jgi:hypothetical protein
MANEGHLTQLLQGITAWNQWRKGYCLVSSGYGGLPPLLEVEGYGL